MKIRISLEIFEYLWKSNKCTVRSNQLTIRTLESKIITLSTKPGDGSHDASILKDKDTEITLSNKNMHIPIVEWSQTSWLRQAQEENENIYSNML